MQAQAGAPSQPLATDPELAKLYRQRGFWGDDGLAAVVRRNARERPEGVAFREGDRVMSWSEYDDRSTRIACGLVERGFARGERIGVQLPDGPDVHAVHVGLEKAGLTAIGLGMRAGEKEVRHLLTQGGAVGLVWEPPDAGAASAYDKLVGSGAQLRADLCIADLEPGGELPAELVEEVGRRWLSPDELYLLNSTSGTTGLPKMVTQFANRWMAYHRLAVEAGELRDGDLFMSLIPAPYGFAQWTAKFTPALLGAPCLVMARFDPERCLEQIERHRVSVLMCVSTQFILLLNSPGFGRRDLSSLRCMFTGGEAIPYDRAAEFERATGARVLQFFGSNETGALSYTTTEMDLETRLRTAGRVIPWMQVRLFDEDGLDVTAAGGPGQPACKGPLTSLGYFGDDAANRELLTPDGWMLTGDVCVLENGFLRIVGRRSDFIIRGGKNISAAEVEEEVGAHPAVALVAAVAAPDEVFGERVACYIVLHEGATLTLDQLREHLRGRGMSIEGWPERLIIVESLPISSGAKVAKGELRADIRRRLAEEGAVAG
jgi:acyl-CoA synthetase